MYLSKFQKANKIFTDRVEPKEYLENEFKRLKELKDYKKIVSFYGIGGIGKTRFLKEMKYMEEKNDSITLIQVNFDIYEFDSPVKIILSMRKQLDNIDFTFFDYALIQYYIKNGFNHKDILEKVKSMKSGIGDALISLSDTGASELIPYYSLAKNIYKGIKKASSFLKYKKYEEDFKSIEALDANEIYKFLPKMLAAGINENNKKIIFFLDDFESMLKRIKDMSISDDALKWLIDFFNNTNSILLVIAARDKLNVEQKYPEISKYVYQYYLDKLSLEDSKLFLRTVPIKEEEIVEEVANLSLGIPLYLDMCADLYVNSDNFDFRNLSIREIIDRYLRHLDPQERDLVLYLSYLNTFEINFVEYLAKQKNIAISKLHLKEFLELSLFIDNNEYKKIDSSIKAHIFECGMNDNITGICGVIRKYLNEVIKIEDEHYIHYFNQIIYLYGRTERPFELNEIEDVLYMVARLIDRGYGSNIEKVIINANKTNSHFLPFYNYYKVLYFRRIGKIKEAKEFYENEKANGFKSNVFGKLESSYEFIYTQVLHLLGNYDLAMAKYKEIIDDYELFGASEIELRTVHLARIKYADIMFLKGDFIKSLGLVNRIDLNSLVESEIKMEVLRVKAHIFRFNYMYDKAIRIYNYILENESKNDLKIMGNIYTNLTESYAFIDPLVALEYSEKSLEINKAIKSNVEIGKTLAARAIALSRLSKFGEALLTANEAIIIQTKTGYKSGILFGLISKLYIEYLRSSASEELDSLIKQINDLFSELGVYKHLGLLINKISGKDLFILDNINWLNFEETFNNLIEL